LSVKVLAPAKVNLALHVLYTRDDGYQELHTSMLALSLGDVVSAEATEASGVTLTVEGEHALGVPEDETNLVHRAVSALLEGEGSSKGVALELSKCIPAGAGLGGGSADAAAALVATRAALGLVKDEARDREILAGLGSDTVFFQDAVSGHALCKGRGEKVTPLSAVGDWAVLVLTPALHVSTAEVFKAFVVERSTEAEDDSVMGAALKMRRRKLTSFDLSGETAAKARSSLDNDLEGVALKLHAELLAWRESFDAVGLDHARLTGSGSSFFAIFDSEREAEEALRAVLAQASALPKPRLACVTTPAHGVSKRL